MDKVNHNQRLKNIQRGPDMWVKHTHTGAKELSKDIVTGVKCIAANNEYLSSPAGDYFGNSWDSLNILIEYSDSISGDFIYQGNGTTDYIYIYKIPLLLRILYKVSGVTTVFDFIDAGGIPDSGKIEYIGGVDKLELYFDDILVETFDTTGLGFLNINTHELEFGSFRGDVNRDTTLNSIRINNHEWTATNWTAPTTTNSQGVETELHSAVSTAAMIIQTN